jgi:hypothetical protein
MIIDAHCHLGNWPQFHIPDVSITTLLKTMDRLEIELAIAYDNVYLDLAGDGYALGLVEYLVAQVGAERILYGSDLT